MVHVNSLVWIDVIVSLIT
jgi:hypothetical protein